MRKIIYTRPDGGLSIVIPVINTIGEAEGFTEAQAEQRAWEKLPEDAINPRWVDDSAIPTDRTFRDAWEDDGKKIKHNMVKAQKIHMDRIRVVRNAELAKLDIPQMTAISKGDTVSAADIEKKKQALRDIPATFDLTKAKSADGLKALWPLNLLKG